MATEASPLKLDDLLTPYPYMGLIKGNEDTIARTLVGMKPRWESTLANSYGFMPAFYTTEKSAEAVQKLGELPIYMLLVVPPRDEDRPVKVYKKAWIASAKAVINHCRDKGVELDWNGKAVSCLWLSDYRHLEATYQNPDGSLSDVTLGAIEAEAEEYHCPLENVTLLKQIINEYSKHTFPYFFPYNKIEKYFGVETIYNLDLQQLRYILQSIQTGKLAL